MTGGLGIVDAGLTAVATLATLGVVLVTRNTLKASREANEQLRQSEASARVLSALHESPVRDANVARALREAELARRAFYRYRELEAIRLQLSVAGIANPINHPHPGSAPWRSTASGWAASSTATLARVLHVDCPRSF